MATRAESLIRQFCTQREGEINDEGREARSKIPEHLKVTVFPAAVQRKIRELRKLQRQAEHLITTLTKFGLPRYELTTRRMVFTNPAKDHLIAAHNKRQTERHRRLLALRQQAYIDIMGKSPAECAKIVERVRKELAKI